MKKKLVCFVIMLVTGWASLASRSAISLSPDLNAKLQNQREAMNSFYAEYSYHLKSADSDYVITNIVYFKDNKFYISDDEEKFAFDGSYGWSAGMGGYVSRPVPRLVKISPGDSTDPNLTLLYWQFVYCDGASIYAPLFLSELSKSAGLEPLLLHSLKSGELMALDSSGGKFYITVSTDDDFLLNEQKIDPVRFLKNLELSPNTAQFKTNEIESLNRLKAMTPRRRITFTLDSKYDYAITEREEKTASGQLIKRVQTDQWKSYGDGSIWLPGRCVILDYATPYTFKDYSDQPLQTITVCLNYAQFAPTNIEFDLSAHSQYQIAGTQIIDRTLPEAARADNHSVMLTIGANGTLLRSNAENVALKTSGWVRIFWQCAILILLGLPLVIYGFRHFLKAKSDFTK